MGFFKTLNFYKGKKVLLLQGPRGPFMWRLKKDLESAGACVVKVNFNGGDFIFYPTECINYRGRMDEWELYLDELIDKEEIDVVILYADWRPLHRAAIDVCKRKGILVCVLEEGYIRPNHSTMDIMGLNGYSLLNRRNIKLQDFKPPEGMNKNIVPVGKTIYHEAMWAIIYYIFANILRPMFPHYKHHISLYFPKSIFKEAIPWLLSGIRKYMYMLTEARNKKKILSELKGKYYLVPLQVHYDSQILIHSPFNDVKEFIDMVIKSFAHYAPNDRYLVFKHHPRDRGYRNYSGYIKTVANKFSVADRVLYIHDAHLPSLIDNSIGVIVVNSSVGFQAIDHGKPTIVLGEAIYKKSGLVYEGSLDSFWSDSERFEVDKAFLRKFKAFVIFYSQINGSYHKKVTKLSNTGLVWEHYKVEDCFRAIESAGIYLEEEFLNVKKG